MHTVCKYCIRRYSCDVYKNMCSKNVISLDDKYLVFNVIIPMSEYNNLCSIDLTYKFTSPIFGTIDKYFLN